MFIRCTAQQRSFVVWVVWVVRSTPSLSVDPPNQHQCQGWVLKNTVSIRDVEIRMCVHQSHLPNLAAASGMDRKRDWRADIFAVQ